MQPGVLEAIIVGVVGFGLIFGLIVTLRWRRERATIRQSDGMQALPDDPFIMVNAEEQVQRQKRPWWRQLLNFALYVGLLVPILYVYSIVLPAVVDSALMLAGCFGVFVVYTIVFALVTAPRGQ